MKKLILKTKNDCCDKRNSYKRPHLMKWISRRENLTKNARGELE